MGRFDFKFHRGLNEISEGFSEFPGVSTVSVMFQKRFKDFQGFFGGLSWEFQNNLEAFKEVSLVFRDISRCFRLSGGIWIYPPEHP